MAHAGSMKAEVFRFIEERHKAGKEPFGGALELVAHMESEETDLEDYEIGVSIARLVRERRIRYAPDGLRLRTPE